MKELMLICIGINVPVICFGIMLNSLELTALGFISGTLCYIGYVTKKKQNEHQRDKTEVE